MSPLQHFVLPDLGEGLADAELVAWHVAVGDEVALNQVLVEVETEKAVVELPSPFVGTVAELMAAVGETVSVGAPLIAIDSNSATEIKSDTAPADAVKADEKVPLLVGYGPSEAPPSRRRRHGSAHGSGPRRGAATLLPRRHAARRATRPLHGPAERRRPGGRDRSRRRRDHHAEDLAAHLAGSAPKGSERETRAPVRGVQKRMAEAMVRSVATAPQACVFLTVDATPTVELVDRLRDNRRFEGLHVTPLAVVARAVVLGLRDHPSLNSSWDETSGEVVTKRYVHLGVAVAGPRVWSCPTSRTPRNSPCTG